MKHRFYVDLDSKRMNVAMELERVCMLHGLNLKSEEIKRDKLTSDKLKKFLGVKESYKLLNAMEQYWSPWDGWYCNVEDCGEVVGQDTGDMFDHMRTHTIKELKTARQ